MRARRRSVLGVAAVLAASAFAAALPGCGARFELPTESRVGRVVPAGLSYSMEATWSGLDGIRDIALTPAGQLFLVFNHGPGPFPRGEVRAYARLSATGAPSPLPGFPFRTVLSPVALCESAGSIFVLDQGDTCLARTNPATGECTDAGGWAHVITNLSVYWRVREYNLVGAGNTGGSDTIGTFTDTTMAWVEGIAADDQGNVYVSGSAIVYVPDQLDPRIKTRSLLHRVNRYRRGPRYPGVSPGDPNMPGADWHRDTTWAVEDGEGTGFVQDPHGMRWGATGASRALYVADTGNNRAQKLYDNISSTAFFQITDDQNPENPLRLDNPLDVFADESGFIYVADTGNQRVLRYDPDGVFVQRVDVERDAQGQLLQNPVTVAADSLLVFVGDRGLGKVIRYRRRSL